jgi:hypothetical protein
MRGGQWPFATQLADVDRRLPRDFAARLSRAWAGVMWRHLMPQYRSPISGFTTDDPIRLLAHNLVSWIPPVTGGIQETLRAAGCGASSTGHPRRRALEPVRGRLLRPVDRRPRGLRAQALQQAAQVKVRFVELTDTIPVHGLETEVVGRTTCGDFMALLDERDRTVVVLLRSGVTKLTEVAEIMGYRNHSAVSKRLEKIRQQAARYFTRVEEDRNGKWR